MFGYGDVARCPGWRRLGGPIEFKDLWPALRNELYGVYLARGGPGHLDPGLALDELGAAPASLSRAA
jgi:hypothetical protein